MLLFAKLTDQQLREGLEAYYFTGKQHGNSGIGFITYDLDLLVVTTPAALERALRSVAPQFLFASCEFIRMDIAHISITPAIRQVPFRC